MAGKELTFNFIPWQLEVMNSPARFKTVVAGRRCGKSRFAIVQTIIKALECKHKDAVVLYIAPTIAQVKVLAWGALLELGHKVIASSNVNDGKIVLVNGVSVYCKGADNPDALRGMKMAYAVLDEAKDLKDNLFDMIIRPALSDIKGGALIIGTPAPDATMFREYYDRGSNDSTGEWASFHYTTYDNPLISKDEIEAAKRTMSTATFEAEFRASWDTSGANILRLEWFQAAEAPAGDYSTYIAIDPAGYENVTGDDQKKKHLDYFAIAVVRVYDDGKWWVQKVDYGRWDVRESAVRVLLAIRNHKPLCIGIEKGPLMRAIMPYLTDLMRKNAVYAHIEEIPHGGVSKANRITYALQGLMEHGRITFNPKENWDELKREMLAFPSERAHDDCFPAETKIITLDGVKPIVEVTTDDMVLTRIGYRKVLKAWCKGNKAVITRFGITATSEHRIWTENRGWVSLDSLAYDDILLISQPIGESSCVKRSNSMEENITGIQMQSRAITGNTTHRTTSGKQLQECSIETYGSPIMGQSPMDTTFTIPMETSTTTKSQISSACPVQHIKWSIEKKEALEHERQSILNTLNESGHLLTHGTKQMNVGNGQESTQKHLYSKTDQKNHALSVDQCLNQKSQEPQCVAQSVSGSGQINSCEKDTIVPVYDLMVEENHEFFANGVLVHNCLDSLAMVAHLAEVVYSKPQAVEEFEVIDEIVGF